jgi:hypothetical protein
MRRRSKPPINPRTWAAIPRNSAVTPYCPSCGSPNTRLETGEGPTGVVAPDGGAEWRSWVALHCLHCGAMEEI